MPPIFFTAKKRFLRSWSKDGTKRPIFQKIVNQSKQSKSKWKFIILLSYFEKKFLTFFFKHLKIWQKIIFFLHSTKPETVSKVQKKIWTFFNKQALKRKLITTAFLHEKMETFTKNVFFFMYLFKYFFLSTYMLHFNKWGLEWKDMILSL